MLSGMLPLASIGSGGVQFQQEQPQAEYDFQSVADLIGPAAYIGKNGSVVPRTRSLGFLPNNSTATGAVTLAEVELQTGDRLSAFLENEGGNQDLDVETLSLTL